MEIWVVVENQLSEKKQRNVQGHEGLIIVQVGHEFVHKGNEARQSRGIIHPPIRRHSLQKSENCCEFMEPLGVTDLLLDAKTCQQSFQALQHLRLLEGSIALSRPLHVCPDCPHVGLGQVAQHYSLGTAGLGRAKKTRPPDSTFGCKFCAFSFHLCSAALLGAACGVCLRAIRPLSLLPCDLGRLHTCRQGFTNSWGLGKQKGTAFIRASQRPQPSK
mmetsp:Transcript_123727/g.309250  ORF Transcript_123727/g.309250 Transcript_123727/m.309250 type:complete len:217 (+) Transcript_123727:2087-2737(+)